MHRLARMGLAALGLAVSAPTVGRAQQYLAPAPGANSAPAPSQAAPKHRHRRTLLGREVLCTECQREQMMKRDGVYIPPAPPVPPPGSVVYEGRMPQGPGVPPGAVIVGGPVVAQGGEAVGHAVVGGEAPGHAVVGEPIGADPSPIGLANAGMPRAGARGPMSAPGRARTGPATDDRSVMPSSFNPVAPATGGRPHIIEHLFGLDVFANLPRDAEQRRRDKHAMIAYDQKQEKLTELPSSVVYSPPKP